jgi:phosphatidylserine decarboxylase precursor
VTPLQPYLVMCSQVIVRKLLKSLSIKQGKKYDDPASAAEIEGFIAFHQLDMSEVLLPVSEFKSFNQFFYRALKPDARPCSAPDDPRVVVSPADCRSVVFNTLDQAQAIWVKGREFTLQRLLGDAYPEDAKRYIGGSLGIFRLAPQDYHRFHIPVDGIMGEPKPIDGEYYTVNPMAIRSALDVYGENIRVIVPIDSEVHGRVMVICVGAMMVGSTVITRKAGERVHRAEELGYFKFGGSTLLLLFEPGQMKYDDDLHDNSKSALETLVSYVIHYVRIIWQLTYLDPSWHVHWPQPKQSGAHTRYAQRKSNNGREAGCEAPHRRQSCARWCQRPNSRCWYVSCGIKPKTQSQAGKVRKKYILDSSVDRHYDVTKWWVTTQHDGTNESIWDCGSRVAAFSREFLFWPLDRGSVLGTYIVVYELINWLLLCSSVLRRVS